MNTFMLISAILKRVLLEDYIIGLSPWSKVNSYT